MLRTLKAGKFKKTRRNTVEDCRCDRCQNDKQHKHRRRELSAKEQMHDDT